MSDPSQYVSWLGALLKAHSIDRVDRSIETPTAGLRKHINPSLQIIAEPHITIQCFGLTNFNISKQVIGAYMYVIMKGMNATFRQARISRAMYIYSYGILHRNADY